MGRYIFKRLLIALPVIFGVITVTFVLLYLLPGDPASTMLARSGASAQQIAQLRTELGLDDPLYIQYAKYLSSTVQGDFGRSIVSQEPVLTLLMERIPTTLELVIAALLLAIPFGTLLGMIAAVHQNTWIDRLVVAFASIGVSMPSFWLGLMLILFFSVTLGWLPSFGQGSLKHLILPAAVLGFGAIGTITRTARTSMLDVLKQDYIITARSKGLAEHTTLLRHAIRNALIPIVTIIGLQFGWLLSGAIIVEAVFSRQGLGLILIDSVLEQDLPVVQGAVLLTSVIYIFLNLVVDLTYGFVDPKVRYD
jgi:ABC-type dipeptide/oligopeptide/nickel transport system permease component